MDSTNYGWYYTPPSPFVVQGTSSFDTTTALAYNNNLDHSGVQSGECIDFSILKDEYQTLPLSPDDSFYRFRPYQEAGNSSYLRPPFGLGLDQPDPCEMMVDVNQGCFSAINRSQELKRHTRDVCPSFPSFIPDGLPTIGLPEHGLNLCLPVRQRQDTLLPHGLYEDLWRGDVNEPSPNHHLIQIQRDYPSIESPSQNFGLQSLVPPLSPSTCISYPSSAGFRSVPHRFGFPEGEIIEHGHDTYPNGESCSDIGVNEMQWRSYEDTGMLDGAFLLCTKQPETGIDHYASVKCEQGHQQGLVLVERDPEISRPGRHPAEHSELDNVPSIAKDLKRWERHARDNSRTNVKPSRTMIFSKSAMGDSSAGNMKQHDNPNTSLQGNATTKRHPAHSTLKHVATSSDGHHALQQCSKFKKPTPWSEKESALCIRMMKLVKSRGSYKRVDDLWSQVSQEMKKRSTYRSAAAVKNAWNRELRARSGFDERAKPNPRNMRTGLLPTSKNIKA